MCHVIKFLSIIIIYDIICIYLLVLWLKLKIKIIEAFFFFFLQKMTSFVLALVIEAHNK